MALDPPPRPLQIRLQLPAGQQRRTEQDCIRQTMAEVLHRRDIIFAPVADRRVDHAKHSDRLARRPEDRHAKIGAIRQARAVANPRGERVVLLVRHSERARIALHELTEGAIERDGARGFPRPWQPKPGNQQLPLLAILENTDQRGIDGKDPARRARDIAQIALPRRVAKAQFVYAEGVLPRCLL